MPLVRACVASLGLLACAFILFAGNAFADSPQVVIDDGSALTNQPGATLTLAYPPDDSSLVRLSNDDSSWSPASPWLPSMTWDLTDATTGGSSADGTKTVYVQYDNGTGNWHDAGTGTITLDRTPPVVFDSNPMCNYAGGWIAPTPCFGGSGDTYGLGPMEFKLDLGPWTNTDDMWPGGIDFRALYLGGSWTDTNRTVCVRRWDAAGNVSEPVCNTYNLSIPDKVSSTSGPLYDVRFEFPRPAVTGQLFTIRPVFPQDWPTTFPDSTLCSWVLTWGDNGQMFSLPNQDYRQIWVSHLYKNGGCNEWTFTLPYSPGLTYNFTFAVAKDWADSVVYGVHNRGGGDQNVTTFHATVGTYEQGIPYSTMGIAYLLPEAQEVRPGDPVTYDLKFSGPSDWAPPAKAYFWADNNICEHNVGDNNPTASRTFTYTPDCEGPWETGWTWEDFGKTEEYLRAEFDPAADKTPPSVTAPQTTVGTSLSSTVPATVTWTAVDPIKKEVNTGVGKNQLQMSHNGGSWRSVALPSPTATSVVAHLQPRGSYRFRVRSFDAVGNKSAWIKGPLLHVTLKQQTAVSLSAGWTTVSRTGLSAGSAAVSTVNGASAQLSFTGRSVSWIGSVGSGSGLAQVYIDGALVQTVDLGSTASADERVLFTRNWASSASHTIKLVVLATQGRPQVSVDAFVIIA